MLIFLLKILCGLVLAVLIAIVVLSIIYVTACVVFLIKHGKNAVKDYRNTYSRNYKYLKDKINNYNKISNYNYHSK